MFNFKCRKCGATYMYKSSVSRHSKVCGVSAQMETIQDEIKLLKEENEKLKEKVAKEEGRVVGLKEGFKMGKKQTNIKKQIINNHTIYNTVISQQPILTLTPDIIKEICKKLTIKDIIKGEKGIAAFINRELCHNDKGEACLYNPNKQDNGLIYDLNGDKEYDYECQKLIKMVKEPMAKNIEYNVLDHEFPVESENDIDDIDRRATLIRRAGKFGKKFQKEISCLAYKNIQMAQLALRKKENEQLGNFTRIIFEEE